MTVKFPFEKILKGYCRRGRYVLVQFLPDKLRKEEHTAPVVIARASSALLRPSGSMVYLNFGSFLHVEYKKGLIATLLYRTYTICSDYAKFHDEDIKLKMIWQKNGFPLFFIDKRVKNSRASSQRKLRLDFELLVD